MKLHLPKGLRSAVLACMAVVGGFATTVGTGFVAGGAMVVAFTAQEVLAEDATHWDITQDHSADTLDITTDTFYLGNGSDNGKGAGNAATVFKSGAISVSNGATLQVHGWSDPVMDMSADGKLTVQSTINLNSSILKIQDGSTLFTGEVKIAGESELINTWDKNQMFTNMKGESTAVLKIHNGGQTGGGNIRMVTLAGEGGYAGQINSELNVLAINSTGALADSARINVSGSNILALNVDETLAGISGTGVIKLAKNVSTATDNAYVITRNVTAADAVTLSINNDGSASPVFAGTIDKGVTLSLTGGALTLSGATLGSTVQVAAGATLTLSGNLNLSSSLIKENGLTHNLTVISGEGSVVTTELGSISVDGVEQTGTFENGVFKYTGTVYNVLVEDAVVSAADVASATGYIIEEGLTATVNNATSDGLASVTMYNDSTLQLSSDTAVTYTGGTFNVSGTANLELSGSNITWNKVITSADADSALQVTVTENSAATWTVQNPQGNSQGVNSVVVEEGASLTLNVNGHVKQYSVFNGNTSKNTTISLKEGATLNSSDIFGWSQNNAGKRRVELDKDSTWNISNANEFYLNKTTILLNGGKMVLGDGVNVRVERGNDNLISTSATSEQMSVITSADGATGTNLVAQNFDLHFDVKRSEMFELDTTNTADLKVEVALKSNGNKWLIKDGDGVLELTKANDYRGDSYINGGTLKLSGDATLSTGVINMSDGTTLELARTGTVSITNTFRGSSFNIVHSGTGTSTLTGLQVWNGEVLDVKAGTLKLGGSMTLGAGLRDASVAAGAVLDVSAITAISYDFDAWELVSSELQDDGLIHYKYELAYAEEMTGVDTLVALDVALSADKTNHQLVYEKTVSQDALVLWDENWGEIEMMQSPTSLQTCAPTGDIVLSTADEGKYLSSSTISAELTGSENTPRVYGTGAPHTGEVWIRATGGTYNRIVGTAHASWGGGNKNFTGDTHILLDGSDVSVHNIIGGVYQDGGAPVFDGNSYISVKNGNVLGMIVGGSTIAHGEGSTFKGDSNIWIYKELSGNTGAATIDDAALYAVIGGNLHGANVGKLMKFNGNTHINVLLEAPADGLAKTFDRKIVGGNAGASWNSGWGNRTHFSELTGDTEVNIESTEDYTFSDVIMGGSFLTQNSKETSYTNIVGDTNVNISGGKYTAAIVGGSYSEGDFVDRAMSLDGTANVTIEGGEFTGDVVGGMYLSTGHTASILESAVVISGGTLANVYGASYLGEGDATLTHDIATTVLRSTKLDDGKVVVPEVTGNLVGGMLIGGEDDTALSCAELGDVEISIDGAVVNNVYGGSDVRRDNAEAIVEQGGIVINLKSGEIKGDLYAAGIQNNSTTITTATVEVNIADAMQLTKGKVISGGYGGAGTGSTITGDSVLNLTGVSRDVSGIRVQDFTEVNVEVETLGIYDATEFSGIGSINIGAGTNLSFWDGKADTTNGSLALGGDTVLTLLATEPESSMLRDSSISTLGDLTVKLPEDWATTDESGAITLISGLGSLSLPDAEESGRLKASDVFSTLNGLSFDSYKETYYLELDEEGNLKLVNGSVGAADFYWRGGATDTWSSETWDGDIEDGAEDYIYIQNVPHQTAVNAIFDGEEQTSSDASLITVDSDAVVDTLTVSGGNYAFSQFTADDGSKVGSLTVKDTFSVEAGASADMQMDITAYDVEVAGSLKAGTITLGKKDAQGKVTPGSLTAAKDSTLTISALAGEGTVTINEAVLAGTLSGRAADETTGDSGISVAVNGATVLAQTSLSLSNAGIGGVIANEGSLTFSGTMDVLETMAGENLSTFSESTGTEIGTATGDGYLSKSVQYIVTTGNGTVTDNATWSVNGSTEGVSSDGCIVSQTEGKDLTAYWVNNAVTQSTVSLHETTSKFILNGGTLTMDGESFALETNANVTLQNNLPNSEEKDTESTILLTGKLNAADLTVHSGTSVVLQGSGTYDLGEGTSVASGISGITDSTGWTGIVETDDITGTDVDISALGNANSTVVANSISVQSLTAGAVGLVDVLGDVSLTSGSSSVNDMLVGGNLTVGTAAESSLSALNLEVRGSATVGGEKASGIEVTETAYILGALNIDNGSLVVGSNTASVADDGSQPQPTSKLTVMDTTSVGGTAKSTMQVFGDAELDNGLVLSNGSTAEITGDLNLGDGGITYNDLDKYEDLTNMVKAGTLAGDTLALTLDSAELKALADAKRAMTVLTLTEGTSDAEVSLNGGSNVLKTHGAKYAYSLDWDTAGQNVVLDYVANENYMKEAFENASANGKAGAAIMDEAFVQNRTEKGDLKEILAAVDAAVEAGTDIDKELAAVAGSSIATMGMALSSDVERQLRAIRNRTTSMGVNECVVNEGMPYFNAWVNAEGNRAELDKDGTNAGYQMDSWGGTVGFDVDMTPNFTMGMALTAMYGDITANGPETKAEGDMDTYYVSLFARYASCAWTHTFVATVGMMDGSMDRTVNIGGHSYTAEGTTDGMTFGLMYEVGYVVPLDEDATACLQPVFNVMLRHSSIGSYTEEGTDAALDVDSQTMTTLTFGLGARMQAVVGESLYNRASIFEARALAKVDLGDRRSKTDVGFAGSSLKSEIQSAELGVFGVELGAGLTIPLGDDDGSIFVDGSAEIRSGYTNLNATVGYRINF